MEFRRGSHSKRTHLPIVHHQRSSQGSPFNQKVEHIPPRLKVLQQAHFFPRKRPRLTMAPAPPKLSFLTSYNTHPCLLCWAGNDQGPHEKKKRLGLGHTQSGNHGKTQADDGHLQAKDEAREESSPADASVQTSGLQNRPDVNACRLSRPACGAVPRGTS